MYGDYMKHEDKNFLSETPLVGFEHQSGGHGVRIPFDNIRQALVDDGHMKEGQLFSQVNVEKDALVFYVAGTN